MIQADLSGRRAIVTGGASGIGLATVTMLARMGAKVALNYLPDDPQGPEQIARLTGAGMDVIGAPGNVAQPGVAESMVTTAIEAMGGLDYLVNNAGTPNTPAPIPPSDLERLDEDFWQIILNTNLIGPFRCAKAAAGALRESQGAIVNTASIAGLGQQGSSSVYSASKAGLVSLTRSLARGLGPEVRVNAVAPGSVNSPWQKDWPQQRKQESAERAALKRMCEPEDIAEVIFFLCVSGRMITGETVVVDGGLTL
ncbi:MAG: SDR family oxidoreductase [Candidatus Competibacteraceae bacterium]|nr:SDR family oxidoreductase [Candidatus Competibacteraceae bacterium]